MKTEINRSDQSKEKLREVSCHVFCFFCSERCRLLAAQTFLISFHRIPFSQQPFLSRQPGFSLSCATFGPAVSGGPRTYQAVNMQTNSSSSSGGAVCPRRLHLNVGFLYFIMFFFSLHTPALRP